VNIVRYLYCSITGNDVKMRNITNVRDERHGTKRSALKAIRQSGGQPGRKLRENGVYIRTVYIASK